MLPNGLALLGETEKFVTVADKRFTDIAVQDDAIGVTLAGVPGEQVTVEAFDKVAGQKLAPVSVTVGADGTATATLSR